MALDEVEKAHRKTRRRELTVVTLLISELCLLTLNARAAAWQPVNPLDKFLPMGALKVVDASPDRFNATGPLRFSLKGARFDRTVADVILSVNGARVTAKHIRISGHQLSTDVRLADGANVVSLRAYDSIGRTLHYNETVWCGNWALRVDVLGADGQPARAVSRIGVVLPGDDTVRQEQMTNRGSATFKNLPAHKIVITVRTAEGATATADAFGSAGVVSVQLPTGK